MPKFIFAAAFMVLPIVSFCQIQTKSNATETSFGRHGSDCSSGRGACSFTVLKTDPGIISDRSSRKISENTIVLQIMRTTLTNDDEVKIAGKPFREFAANEVAWFLQQDDLYLSAETRQNLNIDLKYTMIPSGNYPMTIARDKIEVVFTLK